MFDFSRASRSSRPNDALVAPETLCQSAQIDQIAPIFDVDVEVLRLAFEKAVNTEARIEILHRTATSLEFIQRSRIFRFPDTISVRFLETEEDHRATLAIYSRAKFGYSDMGVNAKRIDRLLNKTAALLS